MPFGEQAPHRQLVYYMQLPILIKTRLTGYLAENGYVNDITKTRLHHEIYMSDARKVAPEKWKTIIRHPIRKR